jgi:transcriptional regulator with XRE-family HTH domain
MSYRRVLTGEGVIMLVSRNAKRLRHATGLPLREVAARGGMGLRQLQKIEAGEANIQLKTLAMLAVGLDVDAEELFRMPEKKG